VPTEHLQKTLKHLCKKQLIESSARGFRMTEKGFELASLLTRRHRLWENYLNEHAELTPEQVHKQAERIEHILTESQEQQLQEELGNANFDPHGNQIPNQLKTQHRDGGKT